MAGGLPRHVFGLHIGDGGEAPVWIVHWRLTSARTSQGEPPSLSLGDSNQIKEMWQEIPPNWGPEDPYGFLVKSSIEATDESFSTNIAGQPSSGCASRYLVWISGLIPTS